MKISDFQNLDKKTKSILEEINDFVPNRNKVDAIDSRAQHVIQSAINLLKIINESFDSETAQMLEKKLISSIKAGDSGRFTKSMRKVKESDK